MSILQTSQYNFVQPHEIFIPSKYKGDFYPRHPTIHPTAVGETLPSFTAEQIYEVYKRKNGNLFIYAFQEQKLLFKGSVDVGINKRKSARYNVIACIPSNHPSFYFSTEEIQMVDFATAAPYVTFSFDRMV